MQAAPRFYFENHLFNYLKYDTMTQKDLKLIIDLGKDLAGCEIHNGKEMIQWEELETADKTRIVNTLYNFWSLFGRSMKAEGDNA